MQVKPYNYVSVIYSHLMRDISFKEWTKYICELIDSNNIDIPKILELASGTGLVSEYLHPIFPEMVISDISLSMLKQIECQNKNVVCCDMRDLPFKEKYNFIFSTFDSVNYLLRKKDIIKMFKEVEQILSDDGIFTFDVSLYKNSLRHSKVLNRKGTTEGMKYFQYSSFNKKNRIHTNKFKIILENGNIVTEIHKQKIYPFEFFFDAVSKTSLYVSNCYRAFTFKDANPDIDRAQFVIKKG